MNWLSQHKNTKEIHPKDECIGHNLLKKERDTKSTRPKLTLVATAAEADNIIIIIKNKACVLWDKRRCVNIK